MTTLPEATYEDQLVASQDQGRRTALQMAIAVYQAADPKDGGYRIDDGFRMREDRFLYTLKRIDARIEALRAERSMVARGYALRAALDGMLPGWFDVDASDHLPEELWHGFVSDSPSEWYAWLTGHGVSDEVARGLLADAGHPLDDGGTP